jgi:hypothetical protein
MCTRRPAGGRGRPALFRASAAAEDQVPLGGDRPARHCGSASPGSGNAHSMCRASTTSNDDEANKGRLPLAWTKLSFVVKRSCVLVLPAVRGRVHRPIVPGLVVVDPTVTRPTHPRICTI